MPEEKKFKIPQQKMDWSRFFYTGRQLTPEQRGQIMGASPFGRLPAKPAAKGAKQVSPETLAAMWNYWQAQPRVSANIGKPLGKPTEVPKMGLSVEKFGKWTVLVERDTEGNILDWKVLGEEEDVAQKAWFEKMQAAYNEQQEAVIRASARRGMEDIRPLLAEAFEAGRTARVSGLTGYGDWIKRWDALHQVNPYTVPQSEKVQQRINQLTGQPSGETELAQLREEAYGIAWAEQERFLREGARPATPPAPGWLPEFVPGLKAGQPISKQPIPIPSGQQLTRLPWSQAQGLAGYAEWAGGSPWQDILEQAQMMQPFTPNIASRWQPARQRA